MARKIVKRIGDDKSIHSYQENARWLRANAVGLVSYARGIDAPLWGESQTVAMRLAARAQATLADIPYDLGGAGAYPLLYFIVRRIRPSTVVETGVAAGFSSYGFLVGMQANGHGVLYSSDFPYFRLPEPERFIGAVVPQALRSRWRLYTEGDAYNLPRIVGRARTVDVFHYDSDKSYSGRKQAMDTIAPALAADAIILMDDIQDNAFFYDYVEQKKPENWHVFEFEGKYVGMIGALR